MSKGHKVSEMWELNKVVCEILNPIERNKNICVQVTNNKKEDAIILELCLSPGHWCR